MKEQEEIDHKSIELIEAVEDAGFLCQTIQAMTKTLEDGSFDSCERDILHTSLTRAFEVKVHFYEEYLQSLLNVFIESNNHQLYLTSRVVLSSIRDHDFLKELLSKATTKTDFEIIEDAGSYWYPFDSVACNLVKRLDLDVVKEVIGNRDYRYETRLLALSKMRPEFIFPEDLEAVSELLSYPYDEEYDENDNYINYDYGQSQMRKDCIDSGLLDYYPKTLVELGNFEETDLNVLNAANERLMSGQPFHCDEERLEEIRQEGLLKLAEFKEEREKKKEKETKVAQKWSSEMDIDDLYF